MASGAWSSSIRRSSSCSLSAFSSRERGATGAPFGAFSAFLVALFAEMYGFPLTIYLLSGWLQSRYPQVDWFSHDGGHLLEDLFGWRANPHFGPVPHPELRLHRRRLRPDLGRLDGALRGPTSDARHDRGLFVCPTSAICRLRPGDVRLPAAVADAGDAGDVPDPGRDVCAAVLRSRSAKPGGNLVAPTTPTPPACPPSFRA